MLFSCHLFYMTATHDEPKRKPCAELHMQFSPTDLTNCSRDAQKQNCDIPLI